MYSSTNCDKNRGSCVNTLFLNQDKECFCHLPKGPSFPIRVKPLPARSPRPLTCLLPVYRSPFAICYINRAAHYAPFVSGFFQLSITCLRAIHTFGLDSLCFCLFSESHFTVGIYHDLFTHSPADAHLFTAFFFFNCEQSFCEDSHAGVCVTLWF